MLEDQRSAHSSQVPRGLLLWCKVTHVNHISVRNKTAVFVGDPIYLCCTISRQIVATGSGHILRASLQIWRLYESCGSPRWTLTGWLDQKARSRACQTQKAMQMRPPVFFIKFGRKFAMFRNRVSKYQRACCPTIERWCRPWAETTTLWLLLFASLSVISWHWGDLLAVEVHRMKPVMDKAVQQVDLEEICKFPERL